MTNAELIERIDAVLERVRAQHEPCGVEGCPICADKARYARAGEGTEAVG